MCGMTRSEDIAHAVNLGVDAIGLIFYPESPRAVTIAQASVLLKKLPPFVDAVAVLVNPEPTFVQQIIAELPLQFLQFHGEESAEFCQQFNKPYIKAIQADSTQRIQQAAQNFSNARALLLDTPSLKLKGGTGISFDWQVVPENLMTPYILAGGLNEENISQALKACHPYAIDLCSGIECAQGIKDHHKMTQVMKIVNTHRVY